METAAVAMVAETNNIPFIAFRSLSDLAGAQESGSSSVIDIFLDVAVKNSITVLTEFVYHSYCNGYVESNDDYSKNDDYSNDINIVDSRNIHNSRDSDDYYYSTSKDYEIFATANFVSTESGIDGIIEIDENGNIFIDLDIKNLDIELCDFSSNNYEEISFEYRIHDKWEYGENDLKSKYGPQQCNLDMNGRM